MFASLRGESEAIDVDLPVLCEFPNVFPEDISDLSLNYVEFSIDLIITENKNVTLKDLIIF